MAKLSLRLRLVALALSVAVLAAIIIGAAAATGEQVASLRKHIGSVQSESFRIADELQAGILSLNATLLRFVLGHNPADWQKFTTTCQTLRTWVGDQHPSTSRELEVLAEVRSQLAAYQEEARAIATGNSSDRHDALAVLSVIEDSSKKILGLGYDLASARRAATVQLVGESQKSLTFLQLVISGALALLLGVGVWVVKIFYREMSCQLSKANVELIVEEWADPLIQADPDAALIIERHAGALRYKTEVGRGTTFGILLPIAREPPKSIIEASAKSDSSKLASR